MSEDCPYIDENPTNDIEFSPWAGVVGIMGPSNEYYAKVADGPKRSR